ncbi:hypothetical protein JCM30237_09330 [Halolamina litorea]|uniref:PQQ-like domain-containing protein n=1 Tax=Halolamina litorea TaxID=1515593 RepID=A0ABD6BW22_9EURY|nr:hypothetical protein [Halolamina litorea]
MTPREPPAWQTVETPARNTLYGVTVFGSGAVAVGESGVVFGRPNGEGWQPIIEHGPAGNSRTLAAVAATGEGARVWFAGESGAVGTYDVAGAVKRDFSNVDGIDADWQAVAVTGAANEETVYLATDEGAVLRLSIVDRSLEVGEFVRPPTLATGLAGLEALDDGRLVVLSRGGRLFVTEDREQWTTVQFQPDEFVDVAAQSAAGNQKSATSGDVGADGEAITAIRAPGEGYRYADGDSFSFPFGQPTLTAVSAAVGRTVAVGTGGGVYRRAPDGWVTVTTDNDRTLRDVAAVPAGDEGGARDVAVGAAGTILERGGIPDGTADWSEPPGGDDEEGGSIY